MVGHKLRLGGFEDVAVGPVVGCPEQPLDLYALLVRGPDKQFFVHLLIDVLFDFSLQLFGNQGVPLFLQLLGTLFLLLSLAFVV